MEHRSGRRAVPNERLRLAREERNLTQAEVAEAIGTSSFTVSRWELGVQAPQAHFREKLCALFSASARDLGLLPLTQAPASEEERSNGRAQLPPVPPAEARARADLLAQVHRYWIRTELEGSLGSLPRIELAVTERPRAVDDPLRVLVSSPLPDRPLDRGTTIADAYRHAGEQLLILGDPGAGKTTLLLELASTLLEGPPAPYAPMPVVFHLASWAEERRPLDEWLTEELHRRYGVARRLGRAWIADEQVLPLLDGLDEVAEAHRPACAEAINRFHLEHGQLPMVVCCRTGPYETLGVRLELRGAVVILPLTPAQVERYLTEAGGGRLDVRALLSSDRQLRELLTTPLFLSIVVRTYGEDREARPAPRDALPRPLPERRRHVLVDYVEAMLTRARAAAPAYSPAETVHWLAWLARAMHERGQAVFYLDRMQPTWLRGRPRRWLVTLFPSIAVVLVGCLAGMLDMLLTSLLLAGHTYRLNIAGGVGGLFQVDLPGQIWRGMAAGGVAGLAAGLLAASFTWERRIVPATRLAWSWATFGRNLPRVLAAVLGTICLSLLVDRVLSGLAIHLIYGLMLAVVFGALGREPRGRLAPPWRLSALFAALLAVEVIVELLAGVPLRMLAYPLVARFVLGMSLGLMFGPETPLLETPPTPGQGIERSRRHGLAAGLLSGALAAVAFGSVVGAGVWSVMGPATGVAVGLADGLSLGVIVGVGVSVRRGVGAYLRHAVLRRLLARDGVAPSDYVAFLEHACRLILLRRRGAGYEFVHRLLLDYFAGLETRSPSPDTGGGRSR